MRGVHTEVQTKVISKRDIKMGVVTNGDTQNFGETNLESDLEGKIHDQKYVRILA